DVTGVQTCALPISRHGSPSGGGTAGIPHMRGRWFYTKEKEPRAAARLRKIRTTANVVFQRISPTRDFRLYVRNFGSLIPSPCGDEAKERPTVLGNIEMLIHSQWEAKFNCPPQLVKSSQIAALKTPSAA